MENKTSEVLNWKKLKKKSNKQTEQLLLSIWKRKKILQFGDFVDSVWLTTSTTFDTQWLREYERRKMCLHQKIFKLKMYRNQFKPTYSLRLIATAKQKHHRTLRYFDVRTRLCVRDSRHSMRFFLLIAFVFVCVCVCRWARSSVCVLATRDIVCMRELARDSNESQRMKRDGKDGIRATSAHTARTCEFRFRCRVNYKIIHTQHCAYVCICVRIDWCMRCSVVAVVVAAAARHHRHRRCCSETATIVHSK